MLLITHAITGAALASIQRSMPAGFFIGLLSHYLLDMIPHYDHNIEPLQRGDRAGLKKVLGLIALDGIASVVLPLLIFWPTGLVQFMILAASIIGSILPDFLQGLALVFKKNRLIQAHQAFQEWIHTKVRINHIPHIAIPAQIAFNLLFIWFGYSVG